MRRARAPCRRRAPRQRRTRRTIVDADLLARSTAASCPARRSTCSREEPLPPAHPFWHHPRITVTPHVSGVTVPADSVAQIAAKIAPPRARRGGDRHRRSRARLLMTMPARVRLVEVGPRDGLQNEKAMRADRRQGRADRPLTDAGFPAIEATSFVSPKWVPQMADAADVMARIRRKPGVRYPVLTPNMKGFEAALAAKADEVAVFVAASETFSRKNINCSIAESLERAAPIFAAAKAHGVRVRGYISCVLGCPYEGDVDPTRSPRSPRRCARLGALRGVARRHHRRRHRGRDAGADRRASRSACPVARSPAISTTPTARRSPIVYAALEDGRRDVRLLGRRARRLPVREGRDRQRRERGRRLPAGRPRHRRPAST